MIRFETGNGEWLAVDVPAAMDYRVVISTLECLQMRDVMVSFDEVEPEYYTEDIPLPPEHTYTIIGISGELSEEQMLYIFPEWEEIMDGSRATSRISDAFLSLLRSHNIPITSLILRVSK